MPDLYGRLNRAEIRTHIRRRVDMHRAVVNVTTGEESGVQQLDPLITNDDLNMYINAALIKRHIDVTTLDDTIMADETTIDIVANQVEYTLPPDLLFLRAVYFKPVGLVHTLAPPNQRVYLYEYDQESDINLPESSNPTYRRRLNTIILNSIPSVINVGGLVIDYVKSPLVMAADDQVLETPLAWILQEVIVLDCVVWIVSEKMQMPTAEFRASLIDFESRLSLAAVNYSSPKSIRMVPAVSMASSPMGTRKGKSWTGR